jgi:hypothetical protein
VAQAPQLSEDRLDISAREAALAILLCQYTCMNVCRRLACSWIAHIVYRLAVHERACTPLGGPWQLLRSP